MTLSADEKRFIMMRRNATPEQRKTIDDLLGINGQAAQMIAEIVVDGMLQRRPPKTDGQTEA